MTQEFGLIGHPLGHSFSAGFFAEKFKREQINAVYLNFDLPTIEDLKDVLAQHPSLRGFNVTIPYKQAILPYLTTLSKEAAEMGAVNVVRIVTNEKGERQLWGYNTDVIGFCNSIQPLLRPHHLRALVLGTGGASKAIVYGLKKLGIAPTFVSRTPHEGMLSYAELNAEVMHSHHIVVNCSPVGMYPHHEAAPELPYELLTSAHLCYDLVYNPEETTFMKLSKARGAQVKNGLEMLHLQALAAWDIWNAPGL